MLWWRHLAKAETSRQAEEGQETDETDWQRGSTPEGIPGGAEVGLESTSSTSSLEYLEF
jgi:hypothetical protein